MRWVRANRRFGAWWALVAIALQIILSFGHAHRSEGMGPGLPSAAPATTVLHLPVIEAAIERRGPAPPAAAFEYCSVCAVVELAATAVPPQAPAWALPDMTREAGFVVAADTVRVTPRHRLFQARAPPQAA